jgi:hypothetical protein
LGLRLVKVEVEVDMLGVGGGGGGGRSIDLSLVKSIQSTDMEPVLQSELDDSVDDDGSTAMIREYIGRDGSCMICCTRRGAKEG